MLNRSKVRKYLSIRWDISFRRAFVGKSEDEQLDLLMEIDLSAYLIQRQKRVQESLEAWDIMLNSPEFQKLKIKNPVTYNLRIIGRSNNKV